MNTIYNKVPTTYLETAHSWFYSYEPELVPIVYYRDKTRVQMFYFLINCSCVLKE